MSLAGLHEVAQRIPDATKISDFVLDLIDLVPCHRSYVSPVRLRRDAKLEQFVCFFERKAQLLRPLDEPRGGSGMSPRRS